MNGMLMVYMNCRCSGNVSIVVMIFMLMRKKIYGWLFVFLFV